MYIRWEITPTLGLPLNFWKKFNQKRSQKATIDTPTLGLSHWCSKVFRSSSINIWTEKPFGSSVRDCRNTRLCDVGKCDCRDFHEILTLPRDFREAKCRSLFTRFPKNFVFGHKNKSSLCFVKISFEPGSRPWEGRILPLYYSRTIHRNRVILYIWWIRNNFLNQLIILCPWQMS